MKTVTTGLALAMLAMALPATAATSINYVGELTNMTGWRTASVDKAGLDLAGTNVLGTAGWYVPGGQGTLSQPAFVTGFAPTGAVYPGNGTYIEIDNPDTTPGTSPSTLLSGTFNPFPGTGNAFPTFIFTVGAGAPGQIRIGVMTDNLDIAGYNAAGLQLTDGNVSSSFVDLTAGIYNDRGPDWHFFDIIGARSGDVFSLNVTGGPNGCACVGAVSFDTGTVPEPDSWALMIAGFGIVGAVSRRRRALFARV
jgi:hypothetical protein